MLVPRHLKHRYQLQLHRHYLLQEPLPGKRQNQHLRYPLNPFYKRQKTQLLYPQPSRHQLKRNYPNDQHQNRLQTQPDHVQQVQSIPATALPCAVTRPQQPQQHAESTPSQVNLSKLPPVHLNPHRHQTCSPLSAPHRRIYLKSWRNKNLSRRRCQQRLFRGV